MKLYLLDMNFDLLILGMINQIKIEHISNNRPFNLFSLERKIA